MLSYVALDMTASNRNHWALSADDSGDGKISYTAASSNQHARITQRRAYTRDLSKSLLMQTRRIPRNLPREVVDCPNRHTRPCWAKFCEGAKDRHGGTEHTLEGVCPEHRLVVSARRSDCILSHALRAVQHQVR